jgi:hypothetical protein
VITRIPQPQFIGPAPAEVQIQAQDNGTRLAQLLQSGVQEAAKNYTENQKVKVEQGRNQIMQQEANTGSQNAATESAKLKYSLMLPKLMSDAQKDPMSYIENKSQWMDYYTWEAG